MEQFSQVRPIDSVLGGTGTLPLNPEGIVALLAVGLLTCHHNACRLLALTKVEQWHFSRSRPRCIRRRHARIQTIESRNMTRTRCGWLTAAGPSRFFTGVPCSRNAKHCVSPLQAAIENTSPPLPVKGNGRCPSRNSVQQPFHWRGTSQEPRRELQKSVPFHATLPSTREQ